MDSILLALAIFFALFFIVKKFTKVESKLTYDLLIKVLFVLVVAGVLKALVFPDTFSSVFEVNSLMDLGYVFLIFSSLFLIGLLRFNYYPSKRLQLSVLELVLWVVNFYVYKYFFYSCFGSPDWELYLVYITALFLRLYIISKLKPSLDIFKIGLVICGLMAGKHFLFNPPINDYVQNQLMENEIKGKKETLKGYWEGEAIYIKEELKKNIRLDTVADEIFRVVLDEYYKSDSIKIQAKLKIDDACFYFRNTGKLKPRYLYSNDLYDPNSWSLRYDEKTREDLYLIDVNTDSLIFILNDYSSPKYVFKLYKK